jgi:hypothetical protein
MSIAASDVRAVAEIEHELATLHLDRADAIDTVMLRMGELLDVEVVNAYGLINLDGYMDVVATAVNDANGRRVNVLLGNGDGTLQQPITVNSGTSPTWVAVADLNRDGKPDLAVTNAGDSSVYVLLGAGDGTFGTASTFVTGADPLSVAVADFNGDGKLDLATANTGTGTGSVSILLGNGSGGFAIGQTATLSSSAQVTMMAIGDVNGDSKVDVVVTVSTNSVTGDGADVLLGNGTFGTPTLYNGGGWNTTWVALADFTGDGQVDLAELSDSDYAVSILSGNGVGNFAKLQSYSTGMRPDSAAVGDFDFDGRTDLVVGSQRNAGLSGPATVHLQSGCLP